MRVDRKVNFEFTGECFMNIEELLRASGRTSKTVMQVEKASKTSKVIFIVSEAIVREFELKFKDNNNVIVLPDSFSGIDWDTMTVHGMRAYEVYFDHYVVYKRFGLQIQKYLEACHIRMLSN